MSRARWTDSGRRSDRPPPGFYRTGSNASRRHACARRLLAFAWLLFAGVFGPGVHAADETGYRLGALREMAAAGAPGLALLRLDKAQPDAAQVPEIWARWERSRIDILVDAGARRDAIARLADPPAAAPEPFRRWALARRSDLHLDLGEAEQSRALSRELLWSAGAGATEDELRAWRRLVVRSYLVGGRVGDAVTALRRFDQDYDDDSIGWAVLRTRVLLRSGRAAEAVDRLPEDPEGELHALGLLAHLRAETMEPIAIGERAREAASADATEPVDAARYWYVVAEAAAQRSSHGVRALATEQAAVRAGRLPGSDTVFRMSGMRCGAPGWIEPSPGAMSGNSWSAMMRPGFRRLPSHFPTTRYAHAVCWPWSRFGGQGLPPRPPIGVCWICSPMTGPAWSWPARPTSRVNASGRWSRCRKSSVIAWLTMRWRVMTWTSQPG